MLILRKIVSIITCEKIASSSSSIQQHFY